METFKKKVRIRIRVLWVLAAGIALIYAGFMFYRFELPVLNSFTKGFHQGIFFGLELIIIGFLVQYIRSSKSEEALKKMYIKENDEREGAIIRSAAALGTSIAFVGIAVATVIAGFLDTTAFITLLSTLLFMLIVFFSLWGYYGKRI
ncbi:hypothetical protein [Saccharibacillus qingshengii]|uniref:hypothetical protein n=1 Tax=Saccharibacillus qingshengii TaxID=1763540 RepID=UPI001551DA5E|nr:hypothetical protein [Saccharibacillus qingshengii]